MPPAISRSRDVLNRIGGPNSISWPGFAILLVLSSVVAFASAAGSGIAIAAAGIISSAVAAGGAYLFLALMRVSALRSNRRRPRPWLTLSLFTVAAIVGLVPARGVAVAVLGGSGQQPQGEAPSPFVILVSVLGTIVSTVIVLALGAVIVDAWREYRRRDSELRRLFSDLDHLRTTAVAEVDREDEAVRQQVEDILLSEIARLDSGDVGSSAESLRAAALDIVRPMSHELAFGVVEVRLPSADDFGFNVHQFVRDATRSGLVRPWLTAILVSIPVAFFAVLGWAMPWGVIVPLLTFVELLIAGSAINAMYRRTGRSWGTGARISALLLALATMTGLLWVSWLPWEADFDSPSGLGYLVWLVPIVGLVLPVLSALAGVRRRQEQQVEELSSQLAWQEARVREHAYVSKSSRARALHGAVQSAALAGALRLEVAARGGSIGPEVIAEVRTCLVEAMAGLSQGDADVTEFPRVVSRLQSMWTGVCEIHVKVSESVGHRLDRDRVCSGAAADVISEGCSNAIRHGGATRIEIVIDADGPSQLDIDVRDNGTTSSQVANSGLGSMLLDSVSLNWSRSVEADGTLLRVTLPMGSSSPPD